MTTPKEHPTVTLDDLEAHHVLWVMDDYERLVKADIERLKASPDMPGTVVEMGQGLLNLVSYRNTAVRATIEAAGIRLAKH